MTTLQLIIVSCAYLVALIVVIYFTRATSRRVVGAFTGGAVNFKFKADTLTIQIAGFLNITAVDFIIDTSAIDAFNNPNTDPAVKAKLRVVQFGSISAVWLQSSLAFLPLFYRLHS